MEKSARGIGFYVNADKRVHVLNLDGSITLWNAKPQKFVDQIIYFGGNISSPESDVNIHIWKAENALTVYRLYENLIPLLK